MDKTDYVNKANQAFNDREAYTPIAEDPTKKQAASIKKNVNELTREKLINPADSKFLTPNDTRIAHAYGLPKVHKANAPLRMIMPLIGSPTYNLAKWLYKHLKHLTNGWQYSINNSHAFLQRIQGLNPCLKTFSKNLLQRINATTKHARMKKRADLQEKLQALLRPINDSNISVRVVKLSKRILTPAESSLLSKGIRFSHVDTAPTNFLANLESLLLTSSIPEDMRTDIRNCATGLLRKRRHQQTVQNQKEKKGLRSLRSDDSIVVSADKGGATVIMDKTDYVNKANQAFNDREAYTPIAEDPTKKQAASIKKNVNELTHEKLITPTDSKFLTPNNAYHMLMASQRCTKQMHRWSHSAAHWIAYI
ncbi:hypothetical protein SprV_0802472900 [Sparganum proliferum]